MRKHTAWLEAQLKATAIGDNVFVLLAKPTDTRYLVIYPRDGIDRTDRAAGPSSVQNPSWVLHGVGATADQAAWVIEQAKKKLIVNGFGVVPAIAGEKPGRVWFESPEPVQVDRDTNPPLCYQVAECGFSSDLI